MTVTLIHTADVHRATFNAVRDRIAPGTELVHVVRPRWLVRAQEGMTASLDAEIASTVTRCSGKVLCTCTTIGPTVEAAGGLRVDWPMMQDAARAGGPVLLVYCLDSSRQPSLELLKRALAESGTPQKIHRLALPHHWRLFEAGDRDAFASAIAGEVRQALTDLKDVSAVVLAQVSMAGAAAQLEDLDVPVLTSPELALRAVLS